MPGAAAGSGATARRARGATAGAAAVSSAAAGRAAAAVMPGLEIVTGQAPTIAPPATPGFEIGTLPALTGSTEHGLPPRFLRGVGETLDGSQLQHVARLVLDERAEREAPP